MEKQLEKIIDLLEKILEKMDGGVTAQSQPPGPGQPPPPKGDGS